MTYELTVLRKFTFFMSNYDDRISLDDHNTNDDQMNILCTGIHFYFFLVTFGCQNVYTQLGNCGVWTSCDCTPKRIICL